MRRRAAEVPQWLVRGLVRQRFSDTSSGFRPPGHDHSARRRTRWSTWTRQPARARVQHRFRVEEVGVKMRGRRRRPSTDASSSCTTRAADRGARRVTTSKDPRACSNRRAEGGRQAPSAHPRHH
jgi:hypothetical protein